MLPAFGEPTWNQGHRTPGSLSLLFGSFVLSAPPSPPLFPPLFLFFFFFSHLSLFLTGILAECSINNKARLANATFVFKSCSLPSLDHGLVLSLCIPFLVWMSSWGRVGGLGHTRCFCPARSPPCASEETPSLSQLPPSTPPAESPSPKKG